MNADLPIDIALLSLALVTAVGFAAVRNLLVATVLAGIYSLLMALVWVTMYSLDVAFTEAAVGAGISTVLFIAALVHTDLEEERRKRIHWPAVAAVTIMGAALVYGTLGMPRYGDPEAPVHGPVAEAYLHELVEREVPPMVEHEAAGHEAAGHEATERDGDAEAGGHRQDDFGGHIPNVVTVVLASYRGFDTLGETAVIFTAGIGVMILLGPLRRRKETPQSSLVNSAPEASDNRLHMQDQVIVRVIAKLLIPFVLLYGLYVQFHGDFGPGGGFQAGVIFASAFVLYTLVFGLEKMRLAIRPRVITTLAALGVLIYGGTGLAAMLLGGRYLDYNVLASTPAGGQQLGIFLVELGVGITVTTVMISIFSAFAGRERSR